MIQPALITVMLMKPLSAWAADDRLTPVKADKAISAARSPDEIRMVGSPMMLKTSRGRQTAANGRHNRSGQRKFHVAPCKLRFWAGQHRQPSSPAKAGDPVLTALMFDRGII